jgi:hypothetical protein
MTPWSRWLIIMQLIVVFSLSLGLTFAVTAYALHGAGGCTPANCGVAPKVLIRSVCSIIEAKRRIGYSFDVYGFLHVLFYLFVVGFTGASRPSDVPLTSVTNANFDQRSFDFFN